VLLVSDSPTVAFVAQCVRGAGTLVVDVLAITALQRAVRHDVLGRVFGAFDGLTLLAILAGSALVPVALDAFSLDVVIWLAGLGIPAACLLGWPWLSRMDRQARERHARLAPRISLLEGCDLFESVGEGTLEELAGAAEEVAVAAGDVVVVEGEAADAFYVIEEGTYAVTATGAGDAPLRDLGPGDWFGEIGLIEGIPRTATVTARTPGRLLRVDGEAFVTTLSRARPSAALLDGASARLGRTHPTHTVSRAGLEPPH
jgi:hypothetical protein